MQFAMISHSGAGSNRLATRPRWEVPSDAGACAASCSLFPGGSPSALQREPRFDAITKLMGTIFNMCAPGARLWWPWGQLGATWRLVPSSDHSMQLFNIKIQFSMQASVFGVLFRQAVLLCTKRTWL